MTDPVFQVSDIIIVLSDGRVVEAKPVRVVEGTVATNSAGYPVEVTPVSVVGGGGLGTISLSNLLITENTVAGTVIGALNAGAGSWTYSLLPSYDAGGRVAISGSNLVTTSTPFDYETATSYSIRVKASKASPFQEVSREFNLTVGDVAVEAVINNVTVNLSQTGELVNSFTWTGVLDNQVWVTATPGSTVDTLYNPLL